MHSCSHTCSRSAAASTTRGHLEIGGCDTVELAREFGTPAYVVAEDDLRARARAFVERDASARHDDFDVLFASKAFPCTAVYRLLAEEGLVCDVASGGELRARAARRLRPGAHLPARQREVARRAARWRSTPASATSCSTRSTTSTGWSGSPPTAACTQRGADPRHARRRRQNAREDLDRPGRLEVRLRARRRARSRSSACAAPTASSSSGCTCTSARSCCRSSAYRPRRRGARDARRLPDVQPRRRPRRRLHRRRRSPPSIEDYVDAKVSAAARAARRRQAAADRAGPLARRQRLRHALHGRDGQAQRLDVGRRRRRHVGQPAPDALRLRLRGAHRRSPAGAGTGERATSPASTASPAT